MNHELLHKWLAIAANKQLNSVVESVKGKLNDVGIDDVFLTDRDSNSKIITGQLNVRSSSPIDSGAVKVIISVVVKNLS